MSTSLYLKKLIKIQGKLDMCPSGEPGYPKTLALASVSGTSKTVPSIAIILSPPKNAPGVNNVANGLATISNKRVI